MEAVLSKRYEDESEIRYFLEQSKEFKHVVSLSKIYRTSTQPPLPLNTSRMIQISSERVEKETTLIH
jgi:DNA topoisomerase IA